MSTARLPNESFSDYHKRIKLEDKQLHERCKGKLIKQSSPSARRAKRHPRPASTERRPSAGYSKAVEVSIPKSV